MKPIIKNAKTLFSISFVNANSGFIYSYIRNNWRRPIGSTKILFESFPEKIVTTPTTSQHNLNLNTAVGLDTKMTVQTPPTTETQHQPLGDPD